MITKDSSKAKYARENLLFKNQDMQISAKIEEGRLPSFYITPNFKMLKDSVLINNFDVLIIGDTLIDFSRILVVDVDLHGLYFHTFKEIPQEIRSNPSTIFYFEYNDSPTKEEIGLRIFLEYQVNNRSFSDTINVNGLMRVKTKKQLDLGFR